MLRIYPVILDWIGDVQSSIELIASVDVDLARQLRRASKSVALNTAEGMAACGKSKTHCYRIALREMRECLAALEIAVRLRYMPALAPAVADTQDRIVGTLVKLAGFGR